MKTREFEQACAWLLAVVDCALRAEAKTGPLVNDRVTELLQLCVENERTHRNVVGRPARASFNLTRAAHYAFVLALYKGRNAASETVSSIADLRKDLREASLLMAHPRYYEAFATELCKRFPAHLTVEASLEGVSMMTYPMLAGLDENTGEPLPRESFEG